MDQEEAKKINRLLAEKYGSTLGGRPRYRLMWSEDLLEWRDKKYEDIMLRAETNAKQLKKYSYIVDRWILEWRAGVPADIDEIKNWDGYEPVYVFHWPDGSYQEPTWFHCDFLAFSKDNIDALTPSEAKEMERKEREASVALYRAELENEGKLRLEDSVGYTGKEFTDGNSN